MSEIKQMTEDVMELLARAIKYPDKPHLLYSQVAVMGERYLADTEDRALVRSNMDTEYFRDRNITEEEAEALDAVEALELTIARVKELALSWEHSLRPEVRVYGTELRQRLEGKP